MDRFTLRTPALTIHQRTARRKRFVTNRLPLDWKRWIAMLCIACVAVFALDVAAEAAAPCSNAECSSACDLGVCDDQDENGAPCVKHHCCHGTTASQPSAAGNMLDNTIASAMAIMSDAFVAAGHLDAIERPPKTTAIG
jgi:hypothetical protein